MGSWTEDYQNQIPMMGQADAPGYPRMNYIIASIQRELSLNGSSPGKIDGVFGPLTEGAVKDFQKRNNLSADGIVGPITARAVCQLRITMMEKSMSIPAGVLGGIIRVESSYDFGATGWVDPRDRGLAQINSSAHPDVTDADAFNSTYAIEWAGRDLRGNLALFSDEQCAIAAYNLGTAGAEAWCKDKSANPAAEAYVANVLKGP